MRESKGTMWRRVLKRGMAGYRWCETGNRKRGRGSKKEMEKEKVEK